MRERNVLRNNDTGFYKNNYNRKIEAKQVT